jgi:glycosyltransferase involved in cell wall biosynthesis
MTRFGLCMIVKNEAKIIEKCLASVAPYISRWDICDTGSTDNTIEVINNFFKDKNIPGQVHQHEWKGFAHNRSIAFTECEKYCEYMYVIDADDYLQTPLVIPPGYENAHSIIITLEEGEFVKQTRQQIFKCGYNWQFAAVVHEFPYSPKLPPGKMIIMQTDQIRVRASRQGDRSKDPLKYWRDALLMEEDLKRVMAIPRKKRPHWEATLEERYKYYICQSYYDFRDYQSALKWADLRVQVVGFQEEIYRAYLTKGRCLKNLLIRAEKLGRKAYYKDKEITLKTVIEAFQACHKNDPYRAEAAYELCLLYFERDELAKAWEQCGIVLKTKRPKDKLFIVEDYVYEFGGKYLATMILRKQEKYEQAFKYADMLWKEATDPSRCQFAWKIKHELVLPLVNLYSKIPYTIQLRGGDDIVVNITCGNNPQWIHDCIATMAACWIDLNQVDKIYADVDLPFVSQGKGTGKVMTIYFDDSRVWFNKMPLISHISDLGFFPKILFLNKDGLDNLEGKGEHGISPMTTIRKSPYVVFQGDRQGIMCLDTLTSVQRVVTT